MERYKKSLEERMAESLYLVHGCPYKYYAGRIKKVRVNFGWVDKLCIHKKFIDENNRYMCAKNIEKGKECWIALHKNFENIEKVDNTEMKEFLINYPICGFIKAKVKAETGERAICDLRTDLEKIVEDGKNPLDFFDYEIEMIRNLITTEACYAPLWRATAEEIVSEGDTNES